MRMEFGIIEAQGPGLPLALDGGHLTKGPVMLPIESDDRR